MKCWTVGQWPSENLELPCLQGLLHGHIMLCSEYQQMPIDHMLQLTTMLRSHTNFWSPSSILLIVFNNQLLIMFAFEYLVVEVSQQANQVSPSTTTRQHYVKVEETERTRRWWCYVNNDIQDCLTLWTVICEGVGCFTTAWFSLSESDQDGE